ncbi:MAG: hypothetical protein JSV49_01285 [Thermoplasmata archaeon]|nr:MAG: hypothetical protein JSV49_01285 [Thermoplasmata archaeon]
MKLRFKIIKQDGGYFIKLPKKFVKEIEASKSTELFGKLTSSGHLEIKRPMYDTDLCQVCYDLPHRGNKCINCGKLTCSNCYWELASLCHDCLGQARKEQKKK